MLPTLPEVAGWTGFLALCAGPAAGTPAGAGHVPALAPVTTRARAHAPPPVRACHHTVIIIIMGGCPTMTSWG